MNLGSKRNVLLREDLKEEEYSSVNDGKTKPHSPRLAVCMQLSMVCISLVVTFLGVSVTMVGFWAHQSQREYLSITEKPPELTRLPLTTLVTGVFVVLLGVIGLVGSIIFRTITGQTLLGAFSFVLVLVIITEVGAGSAAVRLKFDVEDVYVQSALCSQMMYEGSNETSTATEWNDFQKDHKCCGAEGYVNDTSPYYKVFGNDSVPISCCSISNEGCEMYAEDAIMFKEYIYNTSCSQVAIGIIRKEMVVIATFAIGTGFFQLLAVIFAVCLLYISSSLKQAREKSYHKLISS